MMDDLVASERDNGRDLVAAAMGVELGGHEGERRRSSALKLRSVDNGAASVASLSDKHSRPSSTIDEQ